jgi:tetratricopeptide (TPR) repeat protein
LLTGLPVAAAGLLDRAPVAPAAPDTLAPIEVRDLHYGDVLFEFYNGNLPNALLKLRVFEAQGLLRHHPDDAKLLLGGLYFSQGQHLEAGRLFAEVLDRPGVPPVVRDRARFLLGKVWYQRGYYAKAEQVLRQTGNTLAPEWAAERQQWLAQALLQQG